jgi:hypothetical protein
MPAATAMTRYRTAAIRAVIWTDFILETPWPAFDERLVKVAFAIGCKLSLMVMVNSPFLNVSYGFHLVMSIANGGEPRIPLKVD